MRVFLDSNVIVSGIAFRGIEHEILRFTFLPGSDFVISEDVKDEVLRVLREEFPRLRAEAEEIVSLVRAEVVPRRSYEARLRDFPRLRDAKDAHVLAAALAAGCDVIATGDKDLLVLGEVEGVRIVRPARVLQELRGLP